MSPLLMSGSRPRWFGALTPLLALFALEAAAQAATLRVPADFASIQAAIDAAVAGDEVLVAPGVYAEAIDLSGKAITVRSENGAGRTTIDGGGAPLYVVTIASGETADTVLEGFTISGGLGPQTGGTGLVGGGVLVRNSSPVLRGLVVRDNTGLEGGGMHVDNGAPLVIDSSFLDNQSHQGGGLYAIFSAATLERLVFEGNRAVYGGGALSVLGGSLWLSQVELNDNSANSFGAGMLLNHVDAHISELLAQRNGSAEFHPDGSATFTTFGGGGVYATNSFGRIDRSIFRDNVAAAGGGIYIAGSGTLSVLNSASVENRSGIWGGGVFLNGSSPNLVNCTIANNFPGGVFTTYGAFPTIRNCVVSGNGNEVYVGVDVYGNGLANLAYTLTGDPVLTGATLGAGMLVADPELDSSYAPLAGSPVIDAGDNSALPMGAKLDLNGDPRFVDDPATPDTGVGQPPIVDLGAVEYAPPLPLFGRRP